MKKTIIAAAIATVIAAPAAMADVSVSGNVEQTYVELNKRRLALF
jgi:predicted regulator of Ras-like GTPase activity (Roadblock/LC7/MglB family)